MLRLSRSHLDQREVDAVARVLLEDGYLGMGREVEAFEMELATYLGVAPGQVTCVSSGTAALHLAMEAVLAPGDEVLVPSITYVASFQAVSAAGAVPVACDVSPETVTLNLADAERRLSANTRAVMPVHYASNPGDLDAVYVFAQKYGLRVIEDAAHAFGCRHKGRKVGATGDIVCFSFDGIKNITSGEGGALVTGDTEVAGRVRDARLLGVHKDTEKRYAGERSWEFDVTRQGYRYHMSNVMAAIGRVQLRRFEEEFKPKRIALARHYRERLAGLSRVGLLDTDLGPVVPHIFPVRILDGMRDKVSMALEDRQIQTGLHYKPNHLLTKFGGGRISLPVAERLYRELLSLPLHPGLTEADVDRVVDAVAEVLQ